MPEGLAETMSDEDLVDLLAFLSSLRQPVSIVGQYHVIGPLAETGGTRAFDLGAKVDLASPLRSPDGKELAWRRVDANAEGLVDVTPLAGDDPSRAVYLYVPVVSPIAQEARLVLDTKAHVEAWLNGRPVTLPEPGADSTRDRRREPAPRPERAADPPARRSRRPPGHDPRGGPAPGVPDRRCRRSRPADRTAVSWRSARLDRLR